MDKFFVTVLKVKNNTNNSFNSIVIIGAAWYLSWIVLVYLYTVILISCITIPKLRPIDYCSFGWRFIVNSIRFEVAAIKIPIFNLPSEVNDDRSKYFQCILKLLLAITYLFMNVTTL